MPALSPKQAIVDAQERRDNNIPEFVIEAFNNAILSKINTNGYALLYYDDVIPEISAKSPTYTRDYIFKHNWLDVENIFRKAGWTVTFVKQPYYESLPDYWEFDQH